MFAGSTVPNVWSAASSARHASAAHVLEQRHQRQRRRRLEGEPGDAAGVRGGALDVVRDEGGREHQPQVARDRRLQRHRPLDGALDVLVPRLGGDRVGDDVVRGLRVGVGEQVDGAPQQRHRVRAGTGDGRVETLQLAPQCLSHVSPSGR